MNADGVFGILVTFSSIGEVFLHFLCIINLRVGKNKKKIWINKIIEAGTCHKKAALTVTWAVIPIIDNVIILFLYNLLEGAMSTSTRN